MHGQHNAIKQNEGFSESVQLFITARLLLVLHIRI